jgi:hypothetical protein
MATAMVESAGGFLCMKCNCFVKLKSSMRRHMQENHHQSNIQFSCPMCKRLYKNRNSFSVHIYTTHPELRGADYSRFAVGKGPADV